MADAKAVLEFAKKNDVKILDLRFTDLPGLWHHVSFPIEQLSEASFEEGFGMDGSSIRGWAAIHESDMLLIPDPNFYLLDPFTEVSTLVMVCDVIDPVTKQRYDRDPRYIARKAEMFLASTGIADTAYFGAEASFLSSTMCVSIRRSSSAFISLMRKKEGGTPAVRRTISATGRATRKGTSRCRRPTTTRTCAAKW